MILAALALAAQVATGGNDSLRWTYDDIDAFYGAIETFVVCLDSQPTAACAKVPTSAGVAGTGDKSYAWKLPPLVAGTHKATVQACTAAAAACSTGAALTFTVTVTLANPKNLGLAKSGG